MRGAPMAADLHRIVWRWHFYAGIIVLPLLAWLAITGALYLYKPELERLIYRDWLIRPASASTLPADTIVARAERATGAHVRQLLVPAAPDESWRITLDRDGVRQTAFVDPVSGRVRGITAREGGALRLVRDLHSLVLTGPIGNALIEIVAGWAIILVVTGLWLWWPRGGAPALALRGTPRRRLFWRDLHASTGLLAAGVVLFLAVTGLPWSVFWGKQLQTRIAAAGLGRPAAPARPPDAAHAHHPASTSLGAEAPWALQGLAVGGSSPDRAAPAIGIGAALDIAGRRGLARPLLLTRPDSPGAPYVLTPLAARSDAARVLVIGADGRVLQDVGAADFGVGARVVEWGIAVHQGQQYGAVNRAIMLAGCLALLLLALTAPVLWWKRGFRPPPLPDDPRRLRGVTLVMVIAGALLPLTGATMLAASTLETLWRRRLPAR